MSDKDVDKGVLTRHQLILNSLADDLADKGAKMHSPPLALLRAAEVRVKVAAAVQRVIFAASLSRKAKEEELILQLTRDAPLPLPHPPLPPQEPLPPVRAAFPFLLECRGRT